MAGLDQNGHCDGHDVLMHHGAGHVFHPANDPHNHAADGDENFDDSNSPNPADFPTVSN